jgi:hypothetical protein
MHDAKNVTHTVEDEAGSASQTQEKASKSTQLLVGSLLWLLAVALMIALSFFAHSHPRPLPFELATTRDLQSIPFPPAIQAILRWITAINDPLPDTIIVPACVLILALLRYDCVAKSVRDCLG